MSTDDGVTTSFSGIGSALETLSRNAIRAVTTSTPSNMRLPSAASLLMSASQKPQQMISKNSPPQNEFPGDYMSRPSRRIGDSDSDSQDSDDHVDLLCSHRLCGHYSLFLLVYSHAKSHWPKICDDVKPRTSMMAGNILRRP